MAEAATPSRDAATAEPAQGYARSAPRAEGPSTAPPSPPAADAPTKPGFKLSEERRRIVLTVAGVVGGLILIALTHWLLVGRWMQKTDNAYVRADISVVAPKVEGYVTEVFVQDNQVVKAGDPLAQIDDGDYKAALARAEANLARARAEAVAAGAAAKAAGGQVGQQGDQIAQAQAALAAAQAEQARLAADRKRYATLADKGLVAPSRLEQIDAQSKSAAANARAASAQLAWQRAQTGVLAQSRRGAGGQAAAAAAAVKAAEADVATAKLNLERTRLVAPIDGVVGDRSLRVGQLVRAGSQLMAIVPLSDVYVVANFKETQLAKMAPNQKVKLKVDAYPNLKLEGRVASLAPASGAQFSIVPTDTATGNFTKIVQRVPVKIAVVQTPESRGVLRPGLSVTAEVDTHPVRGTTQTAAK